MEFAVDACYLLRPALQHRSLTRMHFYLLVILIGYVYVILAMSLAMEGWLSGLALFFSMGVLPVWLVAKALARRRKPALGPAARQPDGRHAEQDQGEL